MHKWTVKTNDEKCKLFISLVTITGEFDV